VTVKDALAHVEAGSCLVIDGKNAGPVNATTLRYLYRDGVVNRWRDDGSTSRYYLTPRGARVLQGTEAV